MQAEPKGKKTAIIVDDEPLARRRLRELLAAFPDIEITGEAGRLSEARRVVAQLRPDAVFLDIHLFGKSGFDLLSDLPDSTRVIFVTAYDEYAIRAFEVNALDYLLKPIEPDRLAIAVQRLRQTTLAPDVAQEQLKKNDRILLQLGRTRWFKPVSSVCSIRADGDYTVLTTLQGEEILFRRSMKEWMRILPGDTFMRIHRHQIVNVPCIERIERTGEDRMKVWLRTCSEPLDASRRMVPELARRLKEVPVQS